MWEQDTLVQYFTELAGYDVFHEKMKPKMIQIINDSLTCVQDKFVHRKNSVELFGKLLF